MNAVSVFAIQVQTGKENDTIKDIIKNQKNGLIKEDYEAINLEITVKQGNKSIKKALLPGYILIKTQNMTSSLWHSLKSRIGVINILFSPIPMEEIEILYEQNKKKIEDQANKLKDLIRKVKKIKIKNQNILKIVKNRLRNKVVKVGKKANSMIRGSFLIKEKPKPPLLI